MRTPSRERTAVEDRCSARDRQCSRQTSLTKPVSGHRSRLLELESITGVVWSRDRGALRSLCSNRWPHKSCAYNSTAQIPTDISYTFVFSISPWKYFRCREVLLIFTPWDCVWKGRDFWYQSVSHSSVAPLHVDMVSVFFFFLQCPQMTYYSLVKIAQGRRDWDRGPLCCRASPLGTFKSTSKKTHIGACDTSSP